MSRLSTGRHSRAPAHRAAAAGQLPRAGSWWTLVAKRWKLGMKEAPELEVPQPLPTFTGNPLEKSIAGGRGLTTPKPQSWRLSQLTARLADMWRPSPPSAPHSSCVATLGLFFLVPHFTRRLPDHFNLKRFPEALLGGRGMRDECWAHRDWASGSAFNSKGVLGQAGPTQGNWGAREKQRPWNHTKLSSDPVCVTNPGKSLSLS